MDGAVVRLEESWFHRAPMIPARPSVLRRAARDPVVRFVVLGAAIFAAHSALRRGHDGQPIVVSTRFEAGLVAEYRERFGHAPSPGERERLTTDWVRQEALVREAEALGLDRGDPIIRRRLTQKVELVLRGRTNIERPTDADIQEWMGQNPGQVARDARTSFSHALASRDMRPTSARSDAAAWIASLVAGGEPATQVRTLGDAFALGADVTRMTDTDVATRFGEAFQRALAACEVGRPCGPIESTFGFHAVVVTAREASGTVALDAARPVAERAILREREDAALARAIDALVARHGVVHVDDRGTR